MIRWAIKLVMIWGAVAVAGYLILQSVQTGLPGRTVTPQAVAPQARPPTASMATPAAQPANSLSFPADQRGHVYLDAAVNGTATRFLVDTGASMVVLTPEAARDAGIDSGQLRFDRRVATANGTALAAAVTLREMRIDQLVVNDVEAIVTENVSVSLLGMTFLKRVEGYEMRDGRLTINW